jgi:hypothetical protein
MPSPSVDASPTKMGDVDLDKGNPSEVLGKCQDYPVKSSLAVFWSENQVESSIGANVELERCVYLDRPVQYPLHDK